VVSAGMFERRGLNAMPAETVREIFEGPLPFIRSFRVRGFLFSLYLVMEVVGKPLQRVQSKGGDLIDGTKARKERAETGKKGSGPKFFGPSPTS